MGAADMTVSGSAGRAIASPPELRWAGAALLALVLVRLLLLPLTPVMDPTEGRYAEVCRQMAVSGDWVTPRIWIEGELVPFLGKPPLHFWLGALSIRLFGANEFAVRLPSLLSACALLGLMLLLLRRLADQGTALCAALITFSSLAFFMFSGAVIVDLTLSLMVGGAVLAYLAFAQEKERRWRTCWSLLVFALLGAGCLTKGPLAVVLFGLPVFVWTLVQRQWRLLRGHAWFSGVALFLLISVPWYWLAEQRSPGFLRYFMLQENLLRYVTHNYGDRYGSGRLFPYGTALGFMLAATLPWTLHAWRLYRRRYGAGKACGPLSDPTASLLFLGFAANALFLCGARQLQFAYVLPCVPLFASWLALLMRAEGVPLRQVTRLALTSVACAAVVTVVGSPVAAAKRSTRTIVRLALCRAQEFHVTRPLVVAGSIPYSTYFYAGPTLLSHTRERTAVTLSRGLDGSGPMLCILDEKKLKVLSDDLRRQVTVLDTRTPWVLVLVGAGTAAPAP